MGKRKKHKNCRDSCDQRQSPETGRCRNAGSRTACSDSSGVNHLRTPSHVFNSKHMSHSTDNHKAQRYRSANHQTKNNQKFLNKTMRGSGNASKSGSQDTAGSTSSQQDIEIPGFYYDSERKKYFKILPGQNVNSGAVTKDTIKQNHEEKLRQEKVKAFSEKHTSKHSKKCVKKSDAKAQVPVTCSRLQTTYSNSFVNLMDSRMLGLQNIQTSFESRYLINRVANLKACGSIKAFPDSFSSYDKVEHFRQMIPNADYTQLLCLWTLKDTMTQRIQTLRINSLKRSDEEGRLATSLSTEGKVKLQHNTKVTHLCWAEGLNGENPELQALFTSTCFLGCNPSTAHLFKLNPQQPQQQRRSQVINPATEMFMLGPQAAWTCAWSPSRAQFSVGTEHCSMLLDVNTRRLWELHTKGHSVHSQAFAPLTGHLLYSGTKKGFVACHDLRSVSARFTYSLQHKTSISHVKPLPDTNYLLASDFSGKILEWDLRKRSVVKEFQGQNEYSFMPLHLDPSGTILYSAGQDCYSRLWDFKTGELLCTIPPPFPASREVVPALCLSSCMGHKPHSQALLLAMKDTVHFYA